MASEHKVHKYIYTSSMSIDDQCSRVFLSTIGSIEWSAELSVQIIYVNSTVT